MSLFNQVNNLKNTNLAPNDALADPAAHEWKKVPRTPDGKFDASGTTNLLVSCTNCGMVVRKATGESPLTCPDCGEMDFRVQQLCARTRCELPGLKIRVNERKFVHIDVPATIKDRCNIYYTLDGSTPTRNSLHFKHPFQLRTQASVIRAMVQYDNSQSQTVELVLKEKPAENSFDCPVCHSRITGSGESLTCAKCGYKRIFNNRGGYSEHGVKGVCKICNTTFTSTTSQAKCPTCGMNHTFGKTGKWHNKGLKVSCCNCKTFNQVDSNDTKCSNCQQILHYDKNSNSWTSIAQEPKKEPKKAPDKDNNSCGCIILIIVILFILVMALS